MTVMLALMLAVHAITWDSIPEGLQALLSRIGVSGGSLPAAVRSIEDRNRERLRAGEYDHMIFYLLQSRAFTRTQPIEPARAPAEPTGDAAARIKEFSAALAEPNGNARLRYFAGFPHSEETLRTEYRRAIAFLHGKEREDSAREIAGLYQHRGLSSDAGPGTGLLLEAALARIGRPAERVLIIGPGMDWAPRTGFKETEPRSIQWDEVRRRLPQARVDAADVNPRVVEAVGARQLNIATARLGERYDLIIATNVLLYLDQTELLLAWSNIRNMLAPGGWFLHNDSRFEVRVFGQAAGMPVRHVVPVKIDAVRRPPLVDRAVLHRAE